MTSTPVIEAPFGQEPAPTYPLAAGMTGNELNLRELFPTSPDIVTDLGARELRDVVGSETFSNYMAELRSRRRHEEVRTARDEYNNLLRSGDHDDPDVATRLTELEATDTIQQMLARNAIKEANLARRRPLLDEQERLLGQKKDLFSYTKQLKKLAGKLNVPEQGRQRALETEIEGPRENDGRPKQKNPNREIVDRLFAEEFGLELEGDVQVQKQLDEKGLWSDGLDQDDQAATNDSISTYSYESIATAAAEKTERLEEELRVKEERLQTIEAEIKTIKEAGFDPIADLRDRYAHGDLTFARYREELAMTAGVKQKAIEAVYKVIEGLHEDGSTRSESRITAVKTILDEVVRTRIQDILLAAPRHEDDPNELSDHVLEVTEVTSRLVGSLAKDEWLERVDDDGLRQIGHEYLNLVLYPGYQVEFRVGFGGSNHTPNVRVPAYIVPAMEQIRGFIEAGQSNPPRLKIVNAWRLSADVNQSVNPAEAQSVSNQTQHLLERFVEEFYPDCASYVEYQETSLESDDLLIDEAEKIVQEAYDALDTASDGVARALRSLNGRGEKHKGANGTSRYVAAHVHPDTFGGVQQPEDARAPHGVIKFGGAGEESFNTMQQFIIQTLYERRNGTRYAVFPNTSGGKVNKKREVIAPAEPHQPTVTMRVGGDPPPYYYAEPAPGGGPEIPAGPTDFTEMAGLIEYYEQAGFDTAPDGNQKSDGATNDLRLLQQKIGDPYIKFLNESLR